MKRMLGLSLAGLLFFGVFSAPAVAGGDTIKVMTRNQYLGADLTPLVTAESYDEFLAAAEDALNQIALNYFPIRVQRLATEVVLTEPDVIGLQEVFDFTVNDENPWPPFVDHLAATLAALAARGQNYEVAATVEHLDIEIPINIDGVEGDEIVGVLDRDVILVRAGISFNALSGVYDPDNPTIGPLCGVPIPNPAYPYFGPDLLESTPSEDGCNYTVVAQVDSPIDPGNSIIVERGFVGVDVTVRGKDYRIVNTHLEVRNPDPENPISAILQSLQAVELVETLKATTPLGRKLILLGDFNSSDEDLLIEIRPPDFPVAIDIIPPYQIIAGSGFADAWNRNFFALFDPGYSCCQLDDLSNRRSLLDERIDIIFVRNAPFRAWAFVTGRVPIFPLFWPPNWASDHGGVFGQLIFR